jgi:hypothetical protein
VIQATREVETGGLQEPRSSRYAGKHCKNPCLPKTKPQKKFISWFFKSNRKWFTVLETEKSKFKAQVDLVSHEGFLSESKMERW